MKRIAFAIFLLTSPFSDLVASELSYNFYQSELDKLKDLIKKLADNSPELRDKSEQQIVSLFLQESNKKSIVNELFKELNKTLQNTDDEEVKSRIKSIVKRLTTGKWHIMKEYPLEAKPSSLSAVYNNKLFIWGGGDKESFTAAIYDISKDSWTTTESPIEWRARTNKSDDCTNGLTFPLLGDKLLIWGGYNRANKNFEYKRFSDGAIYDFSKNAWKKMSKSPLSPRYDYYFMLTDKKLIIWGGNGEKRTEMEGAIYDVENDAWTMIKKCPLEWRFGYVIEMFCNKILIWGGSDGFKKYYNDGAIYDITKDSWTKMKESLLLERHSPSSVKLKEKLLIWGGYGVKKELNDAAIYDIKTNGWTKLEHPPIKWQPDYQRVITAVGDLAFIWGGNLDREFFNDGVAYDTSKNKWIRVSQAPIESKIDGKGDTREGFVLMVYGEKLLVWGGREGDPHYDRSYNDGAIYDTSKSEWIKMKDVPIKARSYHSTILLEHQVLIWGGRNQRICFNDGAIYNIKTNNWTLITSDLKPRSSPTAIQYGNKIIFWGGWGEGSTLNDGAIYEFPLIYE